MTDPITEAVRLGENRAIREWNHDHGKNLPVTTADGKQVTLDPECPDCEWASIGTLAGVVDDYLSYPCAKHAAYYEDIR